MSTSHLEEGKLATGHHCAAVAMMSGGGNVKGLARLVQVKLVLSYITKSWPLVALIYQYILFLFKSMRMIIVWTKGWVEVPHSNPNPLTHDLPSLLPCRWPPSSVWWRALWMVLPLTSCTTSKCTLDKWHHMTVMWPSCDHHVTVCYPTPCSAV